MKGVKEIIMNGGINEGRRTEIVNAAYKIGVDTLTAEDAFYKFAETAESRGKKIRGYDLSEYGKEPPHFMHRKSTYDDSFNVLAFVKEGEYAGQVLEGLAYCVYPENGPSLAIYDNKDQSPEKYVGFRNIQKVFVEQPADYKEPGYIKNGTGDPRQYLDQEAFYEEAICDDAVISSCSGEESFKKLSGETVRAVIRERPSMDILYIKGEATYLDESEPALSIAIDDKVKCNVAVKDIEALYVKENGRSALAWRPLKNHFNEVPSDTYEARLNLVPKEYRDGVKELLASDKDLEYLWFGGADRDYTRLSNLTAIITKFAENGYDSDACYVLSEASAWSGGSEKVERNIADYAVREFEKMKLTKTDEKSRKKTDELREK